MRTFHYQAGDVLAFGAASGFISRGIQIVTRSPVSHVAVVVSPSHLIESTTLAEDGKSGVHVREITRRVSDYDGQVWWLPLGWSARARLDTDRFYAAAQARLGAGYDARSVARVIWRVLPITRRFGFLRGDGDPRREFCSELASRLLVAGGVLTLDQVGEASDVTPAEMCRFPIYSGCLQLKGPAKNIRFGREYLAAGA
jgi:hypothetical protein